MLKNSQNGTVPFLTSPVSGKGVVGAREQVQRACMASPRKSERIKNAPRKALALYNSHGISGQRATKALQLAVGGQTRGDCERLQDFTWQRSSHSRGGPSPDQQWRALACDLDVRRCCLDRNSHVARLASNCVGCSPRPLHGLVRRRISAARPMGV